MTTKQQLRKLRSYPASFSDHLQENLDHPVLRPHALKTFQINLGRLCNQTCKHCHVDAGPSRTEIMTRGTIEQCIELISDIEEIDTVDITGGAPELNSNFCFLVEECAKLNKHTIDRCNLTILEEKGYHHLYSFLKEHRVEIIASLPHYSANNTDRQRGSGVYDRSINALKKLNSIGYGSELPLNLVYNPVGIYLSAPQAELEREFKENLQRNHGIIFNHLYCINNIPINRYLQALIRNHKFEIYMENLVNAFNPSTIDALMCRSQISVSWDGHVYDCDFNQMLDIKSESISHINEFDHKKFISRRIQVANHCFGCTAGSGSSCGGEIAKIKKIA